MTEPSSPVTNVTSMVNDHACFGCGVENAHGLQLRFEANQDGDGVLTRVTLAPRFEGYMGVAHGGIISTILDEVMAWSLYRRDIWAVTGQMQTRFRKPVEIGKPLIAIGHLRNDRGRVIETTGELRDARDDTLLGEATATFVRVPDSQAAMWRERYLGPAPARQS